MNINLTNGIPILALEKINLDYPFVIVELVKSNGSNTFIEIKVRYANNDFNLVKQKYLQLEKIITNPMLIYNGFLVDITENRNNVHEAIVDYYNKNILCV